MKLIASVEDINSIALDPPKDTVTVIGEADPVRIIKKLRKCIKSAKIVSTGPHKEEKEEKKDPKKVEPIICSPRLCRRCEVWYVIPEDNYGYCSIM